MFSNFKCLRKLNAKSLERPFLILLDASLSKRILPPRDIIFLSFCLTLNGRRLFLGVIYRPPASSVVKFFEDFLSYVGFLSSLSSSFVIRCGFSLHVDIMSPTVSEFKSVIDSCCLSQYIDFPTHLHGHTLDLLMAPSEFSAISDVKGSGFISDHKIISCVVDFSSLDTPIQKVVTFR